MSGAGALISKSEREDLQRLIRQREKVLKSAAKQRSAELLADFENQMGSEFAFDDDQVWQEAMQAAAVEVERAKRKVAKRCRELGIPARFAPTLGLSWHHRGLVLVTGVLVLALGVDLAALVGWLRRG
jgi:hypothetical protein